MKRDRVRTWRKALRSAAVRAAMLPARPAAWALRLSGPLVIGLALLALLRPQSGPSPSTPAPSPPAGVPVAGADPQGTAVRTTALVCDDPAISGCDAYEACVVAVTITSGLAPDPAHTFAEGLRGCLAGRH